MDCTDSIQSERRASTLRIPTLDHTRFTLKRLIELIELIELISLLLSSLMEQNLVLVSIFGWELTTAFGR